MTTTAYIGLGGNLGDRQANLRAALRLLEQARGIRVVKISSFFDNPAVGGPKDSPPFLNAAGEVATSLSARELLTALLEIERTLGRVRREKWEPRIIDLDLLLFGNQIIDEDDLKVPHPLMHKRDFVLEPLAEIAPEVVHPALASTVGQLLADATADKHRRGL